MKSASNCSVSHMISDYRFGNACGISPTLENFEFRHRWWRFAPTCCQWTTRAQGDRVYQGDAEVCVSWSVLSSLLPFEVGGGAHDQERRSGAVARGHERADEATGKPSAVRATQDDRGAGVRTDQERGVPRVRSARQGEGPGSSRWCARRTTSRKSFWRRFGERCVRNSGNERLWRKRGG